MSVDSWFVHQITAKPYLGANVHGDQWGDPVTFPGFAVDSVKEVRDNSGDQVVSTGRVYAAKDAVASLAVGSMVTTPLRVKPSRVLSIETHDTGALGFDLDHVVAHLT